VANIHAYLKMVVLESYVQYFLKQKLCRIDKLGCKGVREEVLNSVVDVLTIYRKQCAPNSSPS